MTSRRLLTYFTIASLAILANSSCTNTLSSLSGGETRKNAITHAKITGSDKHGMPTYTDDSRSRHVRVTSYSHMEREPGAPGRKNAEGTTLKYGKVRSAAADWSRLPVGTKFYVKGKPETIYRIDDYGSALVGTNTVDFFFPSLRKMRRWGTRKVDIKILSLGSFERSAKILRDRQHASHCRKMYHAIVDKLSEGTYTKNELR